MIISLEHISEPTPDEEQQKTRKECLAALAIAAGFKQPEVATNAIKLLDLPPDRSRASLRLSDTALPRALRIANEYQFAILSDGSLYEGDVTIEDWKVPQHLLDALPPRSRTEPMTARVIDLPQVDDQRQEIDPLDHEVPAADPLKQYMKSISKFPLLSAEEEVELAMRIEVGLTALHKLPGGRAYKGEELSAVEQLELAELAREGIVAKDRFINSNLRLVVSIAKGYLTNLSLLARIQEGNLGLVHAVEKFDYTAGFKFSSYAGNWIKGAMQQAEIDQSRPIRIPAHMWERRSALTKVERHLEIKLGRAPTDLELSDASGASLEDITAFRTIWRPTASLDAEMREGGETLGNAIPDRSQTPTDEAGVYNVQLRQLRQEINDIFAGPTQSEQLTLTEREQQVIQMRFGLDNGLEKPVSEVASVLKLTTSRVRQLEKLAMAKLRNIQNRKRLKPYIEE